MTSTTESAVVTVPLRIGGESVEAASGRYIVKARRLTGEPIARVAAATRADAERAVAAAADAAAGWAATSPARAGRSSSGPPHSSTNAARPSRR